MQILSRIFDSVLVLLSVLSYLAFLYYISIYVENFTVFQILNEKNFLFFYSVPLFIIINNFLTFIIIYVLRTLYTCRGFFVTNQIDKLSGMTLR